MLRLVLIMHNLVITNLLQDFVVMMVAMVTPNAAVTVSMGIVLLTKVGENCASSDDRDNGDTPAEEENDIQFLPNIYYIYYEHYYTTPRFHEGVAKSSDSDLICLTVVGSSAGSAGSACRPVVGCVWWHKHSSFHNIEITILVVGCLDDSKRSQRQNRASTKPFNSKYVIFITSSVVVVSSVCRPEHFISNAFSFD